MNLVYLNKKNIYKRTKNRRNLLTWRQFTLLKRELENEKKNQIYDYYSFTR